MNPFTRNYTAFLHIESRVPAPVILSHTTDFFHHNECYHCKAFIFESAMMKSVSQTSSIIINDTTVKLISLKRKTIRLKSAVSMRRLFEHPKYKTMVANMAKVL